MNWLNAVLGVVLGLVLGSLIDCIANRSLNNGSFWGRSYCESCKKTLKWYDLFPVFSYLLLQGHCRFCRKKISLESTIVELTTVVILGILFYSFPISFGLPIIDLIFQVFVVCVLTTFVITDLKKGLIPDRISQPAIVISLIYLVVSAILRIGLMYQTLNSSPIGKILIINGYFQRNTLWELYPLATAVFGAVLISLFFGALIWITRGRGMGGGDLKLGVFLALALNFPNWVLALLIAFLSGSVVGIALILFKKKSFGQTIPFGPFLSLGGIITLLWGQTLLDLYLKFNPY